MGDAATVLTRARTAAGLSTRALAARAGVAYSTVSRIEHGHLSPTVSTLVRLLAACGLDLQLATSASAGPQLATLADAWDADSTGARHPRWERIAGTLDLIAQHPHLAGPATLQRPAPSGWTVLDTLLAGIAEVLCDERDLPRPAWTALIPALAVPWAAPGTPRMRAAWAADTPAQLAVRGLVIDVGSLWRDAGSNGVWHG